MIHVALISDLIGENSRAEALFNALDRTDGVHPRCWVDKKRHVWEHRISGLRREDRRALQAARINDATPYVQPQRVLHLSNPRSARLRWRQFLRMGSPMVMELHDRSDLDMLLPSEEVIEQRGRAMPRLLKYFFTRARHALSRMGEAQNLLLVTHSEEMRQAVVATELASRYAVRYLPAPVETDALRSFPRPHSKLQIGVHPHTRLIGYFGSEEQERMGHEELFALCRHLKALHCEDVMFMYVGDRAPVNLPYSVVHKKYLPTQSLQLAELLSSLDALVLPPMGERGEQLILQAMACSLPVIVRRSHPFAEAVRHEETGYVLTEIHGVEELLSRLMALLDAPLLRFHYGLKARQHVCRYHDSLAVGRSYRDLYEGMLAFR